MRRGQTAVAFPVAYLEGIELRSRIKDWQDLVLYRLNRDCRYGHSGAPFRGTVDWKLIGDPSDDYI